ncbi:hypothetical protein NDU88_007009 [Pleurodeles waltl]|uniref:Secreted protein n=1 Tax=Pleurodeles waltl TaxID=8319 RepID=A0AAV7N2K4_PLEWA|nr:hypothetical protein NDU88_007009 [Pleurodeles waltl]
MAADSSPPTRCLLFVCICAAGTRGLCDVVSGERAPIGYRSAVTPLPVFTSIGCWEGGGGLACVASSEKGKPRQPTEVSAGGREKTPSQDREITFPLPRTGHFLLLSAAPGLCARVKWTAKSRRDAQAPVTRQREAAEGHKVPRSSGP